MLVSTALKVNEFFFYSFTIRIIMEKHFVNLKSLEEAQYTLQSESNWSASMFRG
jgi:hypothetical protein